MCGAEMECIGADVSEQLDYQPAKVTVLEHRRKKYGCGSCNAATKQDPLAKAQLKTAKKQSFCVKQLYRALRSMFCRRSMPSAANFAGTWARVIAARDSLQK